MKQPLVIVIEGADRTGKGTFIETIRRLATTEKIVHLHSTKPPELKWTPYTAVKAINYKQWANNYYSNLISNVNILLKTNDIIILDRSYLGEYVYGPLYRFTSYTDLDLINFEENNALPENTVLVYLTDSPDNLISREDGKSHTDDIIKKTVELNKFMNVINNSLIVNKIVINWKIEDFNQETLDKYVGYILKSNNQDTQL